MAERTKIEWCDHTWSPWEGCTKISPACDHCYAEARNQRFAKGANWGPGAPRRRTVDWGKPLAWDKAAAKAGRRDSVFPSLCDPFDNEVDPAWREDLFRLIEQTPNLDWLLLTKRIGNAGNMLPVPFDFDRLYPNVWLGATICNQAEADRDIPKLLAVPARVRFLSIEPMLGPIDLRRIDYLTAKLGAYPFRGIPDEGRTKLLDMLDWVICGGESGPHARPMHPAWPLSLRDQCAAAGVPFFFKQWGEWEIASTANGHHGSAMPETGERYTWVIENGKTFNPSCPLDRDGWAMAKVGKQKAGRLLDGVEHNAFPTVEVEA